MAIRRPGVPKPSKKKFLQKGNLGSTSEFGVKFWFTRSRVGPQFGTLMRYTYPLERVLLLPRKELGVVSGPRGRGGGR